MNIDHTAIRKKERELLKDFKGFLLKQNALALAVGVIIGAAIGKVVTAIVEDLINPLLGRLLPGGDWRNARIVLGSGLDLVICPEGRTGPTTGSPRQLRTGAFALAARLDPRAGRQSPAQDGKSFPR